MAGVISDPFFQGIVGWVALVATLAGFALALWQIRKARHASEAARDAVIAASGRFRMRDASFAVSEALDQLRQAARFVRDGNRDAAEYCLDQLHLRLGDLIATYPKLSLDPETLNKAIWHLKEVRSLVRGHYDQDRAKAHRVEILMTKVTYALHQSFNMLRHELPEDQSWTQ
jgi:hypothetical protein